MKSQNQLQKALKDTIKNINKFNDMIVDTMCDGDSYKEQQYQEDIINLEYKKSILGWVLQ
jgi:regulator of sigma D